MMRRLLLFCLVWMPLWAGAGPILRHISAGELPRSYRIWQYHAGDDPAWAKPDFNDTGWDTTYAAMPIEDTTRAVPPLTWFRLHMVADSSLLHIPVAVSVEQSGASELYLDGRLVSKIGDIGKELVQRYNPQQEPIVIQLNPGPHVLAIRYANPAAMHDYKWYDEDEPGFHLILSRANETIPLLARQSMLQSIILLTLFGIFLSLGITHFLLFVLYRAERPNLYFSLFGMLLAIGFMSFWMAGHSHSPRLNMVLEYSAIAQLAAVFWSLSNVMNGLFAGRKRRFYFISALAVLAIILRFFDAQASLLILLGLVCIVVLETFILSIWAIYKRITGARIIGLGVLLLVSLMIYCIVFMAFSGGHFHISDSDPSGRALEIMAMLGIMCLPIAMSTYLGSRFSSINKDLSAQLVRVKTLSEQARQQELEKQQLLESRQEELEREVAARTREVTMQHEALKVEKKKSDDLLLNILPAEVAEELKEHGTAKARLYNDVSVLFTDFVNFTGVSERLSPDELVDELDLCFRAFDRIMSRYGLEKIKTIGDAYLAVSGLPVPDPEHAQQTVRAALDIIRFINERKTGNPAAFEIRIGIHSGPVIAGIVGVKKFAYDIWGDTVNTAARMEQHGAPGQVNVSGETYARVSSQFNCNYRGELEVKNKGRMAMYFVTNG